MGNCALNLLDSLPLKLVMAEAGSAGRRLASTTWTRNSKNATRRTTERSHSSLPRTSTYVMLLYVLSYLLHKFVPSRMLKTASQSRPI